MHTNFNFTFSYPVTQVLPESKRHGGVQYVHMIDLQVSGNATKSHFAKDIADEAYTFQIEEILAGSDNILSNLAEANGLEAIKAACLHHIKQRSFGQRSDYRMSYLPLKTAI